MGKQETEKLEKKVEFLQKHLNSGKTPDELEKEFETWYEEDYKKRKYQEYIDGITEAVEKEAKITVNFSEGDYDQSAFTQYGTLHINRICTLEAFVNRMILRQSANSGSTTIWIKVNNKKLWCKIGFKGECEKCEDFDSYGDILISQSGKYSNQIGNHENFTIYPFLKS